MIIAEWLLANRRSLQSPAQRLTEIAVFATKISDSRTVETTMFALVWTFSSSTLASTLDWRLVIRMCFRACVCFVNNSAAYFKLIAEHGERSMWKFPLLAAIVILMIHKLELQFSFWRLFETQRKLSALAQETFEQFWSSTMRTLFLPTSSEHSKFWVRKSLAILKAPSSSCSKRPTERLISELSLFTAVVQQVHGGLI